MPLLGRDNTTNAVVAVASTAVNAASAAPLTGQTGERFGSGDGRCVGVDSGRSVFGSPAFLAITFLLLLRLVLAAWAVLIPEEAYYWMYSKYPSLGYLDHPPMVAWLIAAGRFVFGDTELGVRMGTWLLSVGSVWLCYRLAADWCGRQAGMAAALIFSITPLFCGTGFVATPDAPLIFFWLLALLAITRAYRTGALGWWLLAGLATGLGFVSKYPALFLIPCAFLFLLTDARGRRMLARPGPWLALGVALLAAWPVIWWNYQHDWLSFKFQFLRRVAGHGGFKPGKTIEWVGAQFGLLSPLIFVLFTAAWWLALRRFRRDPSGRWRFAACFAIPWLAVCVWHGLFSGIKINWPLPAYLSLIPVSAILIRVRGLGMAQRFSWLHWLQHPRLIRRYAVAMVAINAIVLLFVAFHIPLVPRPYLLAPWDDLGMAAEAAEDDFSTQAGSEPFVIADGRYKLASELAFYMRDTEGISDWNDIVPVSIALRGGLNYVNWHTADEFLGRDAVFVTDDMDARKLAGLNLCFDQVGEPREFFSRSWAFGEQQAHSVVYCRGFKGVPENLTDK